MPIFSFILEKGDEEFDFLFNNTIYKFVTEKKNQTEAEAVCARLLSDKLGQGTLMRVTSDAERGMVSAEIRARHLGKDLRYWIGNGTTQAESGDVTQTPGKNNMKLVQAVMSERGGGEAMPPPSKVWGGGEIRGGSRRGSLGGHTHW